MDAITVAWVTRFDILSTITTDQGQQFTSVLWTQLYQTLQVNHIPISTTAYHPQANGMVERVHRQLKDALKARHAIAEWPLHLPWVLQRSGYFTAEESMHNCRPQP